MSTIKVNTIQNTSGVEQYTVKAWVNFNGTGTVAIRADGNVSSITDLATGNYTVNFSSATQDSNYSWVLGGGLSTSSVNWNEYHWVIRNAGSGTPTYYPSTQSVTMTHAHTNSNNTYGDSSYGLLQVTR
jgi:hypothetical protein